MRTFSYHRLIFKNGFLTVVAILVDGTEDVAEILTDGDSSTCFEPGRSRDCSSFSQVHQLLSAFEKKKQQKNNNSDKCLGLSNCKVALSFSSDRSLCNLNGEIGGFI